MGNSIGPNSICSSEQWGEGGGGRAISQEEQDSQGFFLMKKRVSESGLFHPTPSELFGLDLIFLIDINTLTPKYLLVLDILPLQDINGLYNVVTARVP